MQLHPAASGHTVPLRTLQVAIHGHHGVSQPLRGNDDLPLKPAKAWDRHGHVIHCNSLNKVLAPGLRLGWMLAGKWQARVEMLKYTQSRYSEELPQRVAARFVGSAGFDQHVRQLRQTLRLQREQMAEGGMLMWVQLPPQVSSDAVFDAALQEGIKLAPGSMFSNSRRFDHYLRLSCGGLLTPAAEQAPRRLGQIVERLATR